MAARRPLRRSPSFAPLAVLCAARRPLRRSPSFAPLAVLCAARRPLRRSPSFAPLAVLCAVIVSLAVSATPALAQSPPTAVEAHTNGSGQIEVAWAAVANATGYNVYKTATTGGPYTLQTANPIAATHKYVNTASDAALTYVVVTAIVNSAESAYSAQVSAASGAAQLAAPQNVVLAATSGQIALTWTAVPNAASYDIYRTPLPLSNDSGLYLAQVGGTSCTDTGLNNGTTYTYQVAAVVPTGEGNLCGPVRATPLDPPSLTATVEATAQSNSLITLAGPPPPGRPATRSCAARAAAAKHRTGPD